MTSIAAQALFLAAFFVVFYFVLVRPQQLRLKRHREMLASLRPGLRIATVGGLVGTIVRVDNANLLTLEVADGMTVTILRKAVDCLIEPADASLTATEVRDQQCAAA
jgi:preprotein translocase subunit YajC